MLENFYSNLMKAFPTKEEVGLGHVSDLDYDIYVAMVIVGQAKNVHEVHERFTKLENERNYTNELKSEPEIQGRLFIVKNTRTLELILIPTKETFNEISKTEEYLLNNHGISYKSKDWIIDTVLYVSRKDRGLTRVNDLYSSVLKIVTPNEFGIFKSEQYDTIMNCINDKISRCYNRCVYPNGYHSNKNFHYNYNEIWNKV